MKLSQLFISALTITLISACGGNDDQPSAPEAVQLVFPENNSECLEGAPVAGNTNLSTVTFTWTDAPRATSYELQLKNLLTGNKQQFTSANNALQITLNKNTPYEWQVFSISSSLPSEKIGSAIYRFYNAGEGVQSYAPFPAVHLFPKSGQTVYTADGSLLLQWQGSDIDGDIASYEVLLDGSNPPTTSVGKGFTAAELRIENLQKQTVYYWLVITTDAQGNTSRSEPASFIIN